MLPLPLGIDLAIVVAMASWILLAIMVIVAIAASPQLGTIGSETFSKRALVWQTPALRSKYLGYLNRLPSYVLQTS